MLDHGCFIPITVVQSREIILYPVLTVRRDITLKASNDVVTGICVSQGCVFPAHISLGMRTRVSPHTYH